MRATQIHATIFRWRLTCCMLIGVTLAILKLTAHPLQLANQVPGNWELVNVIQVLLGWQWNDMRFCGTVSRHGCCAYELNCVTKCEPSYYLVRWFLAWAAVNSLVVMNGRLSKSELERLGSLIRLNTCWRYLFICELYMPHWTEIESYMHISYSKLNFRLMIY